MSKCLDATHNGVLPSIASIAAANVSLLHGADLRAVDCRPARCCWL